MNTKTAFATRHIAAWIILAVVAVANGAIREATYGRWLGRSLAHSLAVLPLLVAIFALAWLLARKWPLQGSRAGIRVGLIWVVLTVAFEFGVGALSGDSLSAMLAQYNVSRGSLWPLVPLSMAVAPEIARRLTGVGRRSPRPAGLGFRQLADPHG
jgi:hypothetical protein